MVKVERSTACGDSPKNKMAEDIAVALEAGDTGFLSSVLGSDSAWNTAAGTLQSAGAILDEAGAGSKPARITVDRVVSHGKVGAANGVSIRGKNKRRFCHVIEFTSVKCNQVSRIESYGD